MLPRPPRRRSLRVRLVTLVVLGYVSGSFGGCTAGGGGVCLSGEATPDCVDEAGGVTLITTCSAPDVSGVQSCDVLSEEQTLAAMCGAAHASSGCALGGDARRVAGTLEATTGVLLGQGGGTLTVSLPDLSTSSVGLSSALTIEILAAAVGQGPAELTVTEGPCQGCPEPAMVPVGHDPAWIPVANASGDGSVPLTLSGAGIEIDDLRMSGDAQRSDPSSYGCGRAPSFGLE